MKLFLCDIVADLLLHLLKLRWCGCEKNSMILSFKCLLFWSWNRLAQPRASQQSIRLLCMCEKKQNKTKNCWRFDFTVFFFRSCFSKLLLSSWNNLKFLPRFVFCLLFRACLFVHSFRAQYRDWRYRTVNHLHTKRPEREREKFHKDIIRIKRTNKHWNEWMRIDRGSLVTIWCILFVLMLSAPSPPLNTADANHFLLP